MLTSATGRQVRDDLWEELRRVYRNAKVNIGGKLAVSPSAGLKFADGRQVIGFATDEAENIAGKSGPNTLWIVDEASGVPDAIFEAIEGNRAGGNARVAMFSNPTQTSGTFFDAFHSKREFWHPIHIDNAEAAAVDPPIQGLATPAWIAEKIRDWGEESPIFQVRSKGNFPTRGDHNVIGIAEITAAVARWDTEPDEGPLEIGVDVARFGDDESVIQPRRGRRAHVSTALQGFDNVDVAGETMLIVRALRRNPEEKPRVKVDATGNGGGVADVLRRHQNEIVLVEVNVSEVATVDGYPKLRDQVWFSTAAWLKEGGAIPSDPKLEGELAAPKYSFDVRARQKVESKDEIKKRLKRSPDRADALGLAVYDPPPVTYDSAKGRSERRW